jgi:hypothetical protein
MGLFDFLTPKKSSLQDNLEKLQQMIFPKGEADIEAATNELLLILDNKIGSIEAKDIVVKSTAIAHISQNFDETRLRNHLSGYCIHHFNDEQFEKFYSYVRSLLIAKTIHGKSAVDVKRMGNGYAW